MIFYYYILLIITTASIPLIIAFDDDSKNNKNTPSTTTAVTSTTDILLFPLETSSDNNNNKADDESTQPVNEDIYNSKDLFSTEPLIANISDVVQTRLYCEIDEHLCKNVETALILAATAIAEVVNLKNKIVFQASYYSFCINQCSNDTFGWGTPSSQFTLISLNEADSNFIYPQALAKQLVFTDSSNWANYDVAIDINHDIYMNAVNYDTVSDWNGTGIPPQGGFWFPTLGNISLPIEDHQVDLEYVILHQMIHGLGMLSSWAPYFSDINSPFKKILSGLILAEDSLKVMTPSPYWFVKYQTGPVYITGFQPNMIFDKFIHLFIPTKNETRWLGDFGFDMQNFCVDDHDAFIANFIHAFLNNATQSSKAKSIYVSMTQPQTLTFHFSPTCNKSTFYTDTYLNQTYKTIQLMTGSNILEEIEESYYRPGIATSHLDDTYIGTVDFLMTHKFIRGKTLETLVDEAYASLPIEIKYNITQTIHVNVTMNYNTTLVVNGSRMNTATNITRTEQREETVERIYKSPIGPGILRILETIGYSTVLTNTNYTTGIIKTTKPDTTCDNNNNNNNNFQVRSDDMSLKSTLIASAVTSFNKNTEFSYFLSFILIALFYCHI
ncbi:uncharacterized protein BX663DRAFT_468776 [Cokeromyces recurvatus]|uniref:uncharacterized protein n=1 Tax=Cokeromyces recurvatus TaxID=90255 RepID=UPI002220B400|nr:uncharacterized protein BX663DRAFT_468776 [Cokeromyces recurvatus]KAI7905004.1 hypothetical protein BX663DRAFT_468776 [Cokeromyces recurvatus]